MRYERSSRSIICTTSGGPVTTIEWNKDGARLTPDGLVYQASQLIQDQATALYENKLSFVSLRSESLSGIYTCQVENLRGTSSMHLVVTGT